MMLRPGTSDNRLNTTGCISIPASLFIGVMIAGPGTAVFPAVSTWSAPIVCGGGTVEVQSDYYSVRPGENGVSRTILCRTGESKGAAADDITWRAIGIACLIYSVLAFLVLRFLVAPWLRRRTGRALQAAGIISPGKPGTPASAADLRAILARVSEAVGRGEANVTVRNVTVDGTDLDMADAGSGGSLAERLEQLRALRDQGLITPQDYDAKKAELLSRL